MTTHKKKLKVLFVCQGNHCRSPMAEGILRGLLQGEAINHIQGASSGLSPDMAGKPFHKEAQFACKARGLSLNGKGQTTTLAMLKDSDFVFAMDRSVLHQLFSLDSSGVFHSKIHLLSEQLDPDHPLYGQDIPDPMHGSAEDFAESFSRIEECCLFLLDSWESQGLL